MGIHALHRFVHHPWWTYVNTFLHSSVCLRRFYACGYRLEFNYLLCFWEQKILKKVMYSNTAKSLIPISAMKWQRCKGNTRPETGRRGLPLFMDDKSAGIEHYARLLWSGLLSWASQGFQGEARRYVAPWVSSPPRQYLLMIIRYALPRKTCQWGITCDQETEINSGWRAWVMCISTLNFIPSIKKPRWGEAFIMVS